MTSTCLPSFLRQSLGGLYGAGALHIGLEAALSDVFVQGVAHLRGPGHQDVAAIVDELHNAFNAESTAEFLAGFRFTVS